jgi:putative acetyltransferase
VSTNDSPSDEKSTPTIRPIVASDDAAVAAVIRTVMPEFGAKGPGFAINDPEVDAMSATYAEARSVYYVVELDGRVMGGGGIAPLAGGDGTTCELRKMYFLKEVRGRGAGRALLTKCIEAARARGFTRMYLETLTGMDAAKHLYLEYGFKPRSCALGATGHFSCDAYYERPL